MSGTLRIGICDDDAVFCGLLRRVLTPQLEVVGTATTGDEAVELVTATQPDALLLDVVLGGGESGIDVMPRLLRAAPHTMVAAVTGLDAERWEDDVLLAGAFVYYEKTHVLDLPHLLVHDVGLFRRALSGDDVLAPSALRRRVRREGTVTGPPSA